MPPQRSPALLLVLNAAMGTFGVAWVVLVVFDASRPAPLLPPAVHTDLVNVLLLCTLTATVWSIKARHISDAQRIADANRHAMTDQLTGSMSALTEQLDALALAQARGAVALRDHIADLGTRITARLPAAEPVSNHHDGVQPSLGDGVDPDVITLSTRVTRRLTGDEGVRH